MNYSLHQLQIFLKVAQLQSITKAAEALHLSQPAVSMQLKSLQDQFDVALTEVIGKKLYITEFGKEIAIAAEKILEEAYAINYKTLAFRGQLAGRLKITVVSTGKYVMPYFLSGFMKQHEGVEVIMDVTNKTKVVESLEKNEVDFSLVSLLPPHLNVDSISLLQNKLYLVSGSMHEFNKKQYTKSIFESLPLIYREQGSGTRYSMERYFQENGLAVRKKMELTSNEAVKQALIAGMGCSIMPLIGIKNELLNKDLQIVPVKGFPIKSMWQLIWLKKKKLSPTATAFLQYLEAEKENIIKERFEWFENF